MRFLDLLIPVSVLLAPLLLFWHGKALLKKGAPATRLQSIAAAYQFTPFLPFVYTMVTNLPKRLEVATGWEGLSALTIWVPMTVMQLVLTYPSYVIDRESRGSDWSYSEYLRNAARIQLLLVAFVGPLFVGIGVIEPMARLHPPLWDYIDTHSWAAIPLVGSLVTLSGLCVWRTWRWLKVRNMPVPPELGERLMAFGEQLGLRLHKIEVLPMKGGKVANAYVTGFRKGRQTVLLTDYLVEHFTVDEIEAILAHEVGHARLGHIRQRVWLALFTFVALMAIVVAWIYLTVRVLRWLGGLAVLPIVPLMLAPSFAMTPILRGQEFAADRWAAEATGNPELLAHTLNKLDALNRLQTEQLPKWLRLMIAHPITPQRVARLKALKSTI